MRDLASAVWRLERLSGYGSAFRALSVLSVSVLRHPDNNEKSKEHAVATSSDESARQRELDRYRVVDSLPEEAYNDIVRLAALVCGTPTALLSVLDRGRQWFKARTGFELTETPRDQAFCNHAIRTPDQLFEVPDTQADPSFANNPLVTGKTAVRFYAGMPLVTPGGAAIGTVCVLDHIPRSLNNVQRAALSSLARLTMNLLELRHKERELERAMQLTTPSAPEAPIESPSSNLSHCTVAIFEVQDVGAAVSRMGERTFERLVQRLEETLQAYLRPSSHDSVCRVSGCAELIAVLHGSDTITALQALRERTVAFETETKLRVLTATGDSEFENEPLESIFQRADEARTTAREAQN